MKRQSNFIFLCLLFLSALIHTGAGGVLFQFASTISLKKPKSNHDKNEIKITISETSQPSSEESTRRLDSQKISVAKNTQPSGKSNGSHKSSGAKSNGRSNIAQYYLSPHAEIGNQMTASEMESAAYEAKFDPITTIPAETKSQVMPDLVKIAREIRLRFDVPSNIRKHLAGKIAWLNLKILSETNWKLTHPYGDPHLRSLLYERIKEMTGDPMISAAYLGGDLAKIRLKIHIRLPESDGLHCIEELDSDFEIDGYQITFPFRAPCPPKSVAWNLLAAQKVGASVMLGFNFLSLVTIPAELAARKQDEKALERSLRQLRRSPAFTGKFNH